MDSLTQEELGQRVFGGRCARGTLQGKVYSGEYIFGRREGVGQVLSKCKKTTTDKTDKQKL